LKSGNFNFGAIFLLFFVLSSCPPPLYRLLNVARQSREKQLLIKAEAFLVLSMERDLGFRASFRFGLSNFKKFSEILTHGSNWRAENSRDN
jgi:hypothetical protein